MTTYRAHGTGSLQLVRRGIWRSQIKAPDGRRLSATHHVDTKKEAQAAHDRFRARVLGGEITGDTHTLDDLIAAWLEHRKDISPSTRRRYTETIDWHISPGIGRTKLDKVTTYQLDRFYATLGPSAAKECHKVIRQALAQAEAWGWIARNPADKATKPTSPAPEMHPPEPEQLATILAGLRPEVALFVRLAALTGARRGELAALRWAQVDLPAGTITIEATMTLGEGGYVRGKTTKTGKGRTVALDADTVALVRAHRAARLAIHMDYCKPSHYVFGKNEGQQPWNPQTISHWFRKAADRAGYPGRLHDLRHYHATWMLANGVSVADAASRLGHTKNTLLAVYAHAIPANDAGIAQRAGDALRIAT